MDNKFTRRSFLGMIGASTLNVKNQSFHLRASSSSLLTLFQGDSITDGDRGRSEDPNHVLGHGYVFAIASMLGSQYPDRALSFLNRGNSGDTITDVHSRWGVDALEFKPDVISLLVGINDVQRRLHPGSLIEKNDFHTKLKSLLAETRQQLPDTQIVLGEPFILPVGIVSRDRHTWEDETKKCQKDVAGLAAEYGCILIRYQDLFNKALKSAPAEYWIWDGIHPTYNGHGLMAREWVYQVGKEIPRLRMKKM